MGDGKDHYAGIVRAKHKVERESAENRPPKPGIENWIALG